MSQQPPLPPPSRSARQILERRARAASFLEDARQTGNSKDIQQWEAYLRYADALKAQLGALQITQKSQAKSSSG